MNQELVHLEEFDRIAAEKEALDDSERANMKQHADKLMQGFDALDDVSARRAVWELIQNACDLSDDCEVTIEFKQDGLLFTHNGKPFTSKTLISLIKQVSSKSTTDPNEVGKFGTGFITTHSFGKQFKIYSCLSKDRFLIDIDGFLIDRRAEDSEELAEKLRLQEKEVYKLIREGSLINGAKLTTFQFIQTHENEIYNIRYAEQNLHQYVPYVLTLSETLKAVTVVEGTGERIEYKLKQRLINGKIGVTTIAKDDDEIQIFSVESSDGTTKVILPLVGESLTMGFNASIAKLFLYYPLIGTENIGFNFIIHSANFAPTEARNGIHLMSKNTQTEKKEASNRQLIDTASELIFDYIETYAEQLNNPINLAYASFNTSPDNGKLSEYFKELKEKWVAKLKTVKLVQTTDGRLSPEESLFIDERLLLRDEYFDATYYVISKFWQNVPQKSEASQWTQIVNAWDDSSIRFIDAKMIVGEISKVGSLSEFDDTMLRKFYLHLVASEQTRLFDEYNLLPNIKGELKTKTELVKPTSIDDVFISIADVVAEDVPRSFIRKDFELDLHFDEYTRNELSSSLNAGINAIKDFKTVDRNRYDRCRNALIAFCSIFSNERVDSSRRRLLPKICKHYNIEYKETLIQKLEDEKLDYDVIPYRELVRAFLDDIIDRNKTEDWLRNNETFLLDCLSIVKENKEATAKLLDEMDVFPNQNFKLRKHINLAKEVDFPAEKDDSEFLKETYKDLISDIKNDLVIGVFGTLLPNENVKNGISIANEIENKLKELGPFIPIKEHSKHSLIFKIATRLSKHNELWKRYFPIIEGSRATITMSKIENGNTRDSLLKIITIEDEQKIEKLGTISDNPHLIRIIDLGIQAVNKEIHHKVDFQHKKALGNHLEDVLRERLKNIIPQEISARPESEQNGQDIIVYIGTTPVYYIEVKSKWIEETKIRMSRNQTLRSHEQSDKYALCSIDMVGYKGPDRENVQTLDGIKERIKFNTDVGTKVGHLIAVLKKTEEMNEIRLDGEIRTYIPNSYIEKGICLVTFENLLVKELQDKYANCN